MSKQAFGIAISVTSLLCVGATAQENKQFREAIARYEENIEGLLSYSAKVKVFEKTSERLTVSDKVFDSFRLTEYEFISDVTRDSILIVKNSYTIDASFHSDAMPSAVYLRSKGKAFRSMGTRLSRFEDSNVPLESFFDPRVIGCGFCFEVRSFVRFQDVISNIKAWRDSLMPNKSKEDVLVFGLGNNKIEFLKKSGFGISRIGHSGMSARTTYMEKSGVFLPFVSRYTCNAGKNQVFHCDWFSVNEPIPPERFEPARVANLLGLEYVD